MWKSKCLYRIQLGFPTGCPIFGQNIFPFLSGISDIGTRKSRLFDLVENFQAPIWDQRTELYPITGIQIHDPSRAVRNADTLDSTQNSNKIKLNMFGKFQVENMS